MICPGIRVVLKDSATLPTLKGTDGISLDRSIEGLVYVEFQYAKCQKTSNSIEVTIDRNINRRTFPFDLQDVVEVQDLSGTRLYRGLAVYFPAPE